MNKREQAATMELVALMKAKGFEIKIRTEDTMVVADLVREGKTYCGGEGLSIPDALLGLAEVIHKW